MTEDELNELDRLEREATPGPWRYIRGLNDDVRADLAGGFVTLLTQEVRLLCSLRNHARGLIDAARELEGLRQERYDALITDASDRWPPGCTLHRSEVLAFIDSQACHRPQAQKEDENKKLRGLLEESFGHISEAESYLIDDDRPHRLRDFMSRARKVLK